MSRTALVTRSKKPKVEWTPFKEAAGLSLPDGTTRPIPDGMEVWVNSIYEVWMRPFRDGRMLGRLPTNGSPYYKAIGVVIHLSIKRRDRHPIHDWRHLQRIKNELVGTEYDAVELYPAERRKVDTANQYHLWVFASEAELPDAERVCRWGYREREVTDAVLVPEAYEGHAANARQRLLDTDDPFQTPTPTYGRDADSEGRASMLEERR